MTPLLLSTSLLFLRDPPVWPDEALFVDTAINLAKTNTLYTEILGKTVPGMETRAYWVPPLYFHLLAIWIRIFGSTIESVRTLSLLLSVIAASLLFLIIKTLFKTDRLIVLGLLLLSTDVWFCRTARTARMDILSFLFLLASLLIFLIAQKKQRPLFYLLTGVPSALGITAHPLGLIAPAIIILYLLIKKESLKEKMLKILLISIPIAVVILIWFFSIKDHFNLFLTQNQLQIARKADDTPYPLVIIQGNWSWKIIFSLYILIAIALVKQIRKFRQSFDSLILIGIVVSVAALMWGKEMWYILYFQPFITLAILSLLKTCQKYRKKSGALLLAVILLLAVNINLFSQFAKRSGHNNYHYFAKRVANNLPSEGNVFLAAIPDPYFGLKTNPNLKLFEFSPVPVSDEKYKNLLDSTDYLVLNFISHPIIVDYVNKNTEKSDPVKAGGYSAVIIKLVSRNERR